jgi:hypothetical protein
MYDSTAVSNGAYMTARGSLHSFSLNNFHDYFDILA